MLFEEKLEGRRGHWGIDIPDKKDAKRAQSQESIYG